MSSKENFITTTINQLLLQAIWALKILFKHVRTSVYHKINITPYKVLENSRTLELEACSVRLVRIQHLIITKQLPTGHIMFPLQLQLMQMLKPLSGQSTKLLTVFGHQMNLEYSNRCFLVPQKLPVRRKTPLKHFKTLHRTKYYLLNLQ